MADNAKKIGLVIASGLPAPGKMMKRGMSDEGESDSDAASEADSGDEGGGMSALGDMWDALKQGDKTAAWDAFCDAIDIAKNRDKGGSEDSSAGTSDE
jgi:hypothetical protein